MHGEIIMRKNKSTLADHFDPTLKRIVLKLLKERGGGESVAQLRESLLREMLIQNSDATSVRETHYPENELIQSHWLRIAGLEEED